MVTIFMYRGYSLGKLNYNHNRHVLGLLTRGIELLKRYAGIGLHLEKKLYMIHGANLLGSGYSATERNSHRPRCEKAYLGTSFITPKHTIYQ